MVFFYLDELFFSIPLEGVYEGLREAVSHNDVQLTAVDEDPVPAVQQLLHKRWQLSDRAFVRSVSPGIYRRCVLIRAVP